MSQIAISESWTDRYSWWLRNGDSRGEKDYNAYLRYYLSDHRPMWMEFRTQ